MRFTKIKFSEKTGVELAWVTKKDGGATESVEFSSPEQPLPDLKQALSAFRDFVIELIEAPEPWREEITITTLSINTEKDGRRGLIVTATRKIEKASGRVLVINTPLMKESGENTSDEASGIFEDEILTLIANAETAATRYHKGEREQLDAFQAEQPAGQADGGSSGEASDGSAPPARRRRRGPQKDFIPEIGHVANPGADIVPTVEVIQRALAVRDRDVPIDVITLWTQSQCNQAMAWVNAGGKAEDEPEHVSKAATLPLGLEKK
jgi:hypothetical protein